MLFLNAGCHSKAGQLLSKNCLFFSVSNGKSCFSIRKLILTSEWHAEHPFAGWNTQQAAVGNHCSNNLLMCISLGTQATKTFQFDIFWWLILFEGWEAELQEGAQAGLLKQAQSRLWTNWKTSLWDSSQARMQQGKEYYTVCPWDIETPGDRAFYLLFLVFTKQFLRPAMVSLPPSTTLIFLNHT